MPGIIVTSRYLKSSSKKNLKNYVKYIATREGAVHTVSERENYVGYLANRPGAVKFNSHGLFNENDKPINLEKVAKEVANHDGNVWTHVVSLRRDDAQKMGYDNLKAWRDLVIRQIPNIAKNQKIDMKNLRWYAAFHDKKTNPHVHIIVYSTNEREGFLTNHGIEKIRSGFANDIYSDELHHLYEQQTDLRNLLKKESEQLMKNLAKNITQNNNFDAELINLVAKLHGQLAESKGKKVYGYLKSDIKKTVDEIFVKLADNDSIKKMYDLWCEMEQQKHDLYSSAKIDFPALTYNKEFRSVKNMIIQTVMKMEYPVAEMTYLSEITDEIVLDSEQQFNEIVQTETASEIQQQSVISITKDEGNTGINGNFENEILAKTIFNLFANLSRCIEDGYHHKFQSGRKMIDSKLRRIMHQKKLALGMKNGHEQNQEQQY